MKNPLPSPSKALALFLGILLLFSAFGFSAAADSKNNQAKPAPGNEEYIIGLGDILEINVWKEAELSRIVTVRLDGRISLPLLGDVDASGKSPRVLTAFLEKEFGKIIAEPAVSVMLQESRSRRYYMVGQVNTPGEFAIDYPVTILQALARGGGFLEWAKTSNIIIVRQSVDGEMLLPFDYNDFIKGKNQHANILIAPGDTIIVP